MRDIFKVCVEGWNGWQISNRCKLKGGRSIASVLGNCGKPEHKEALILSFYIYTDSLFWLGGNKIMVKIQIADRFRYGEDMDGMKVAKNPEHRKSYQIVN